MTEHSQGFRDFMHISPQGAPGDDKARAGGPLAEDAAVADREAVIDALRTIYDPEIPVNIYDLGLIYDLEIDAKGNVAIGMTLTAPACPVAGEMPQWVADAVADVEGVGEVEVAMVWDPPWTPARMSEDARMILDMG
jgi:FeS assembly SUF system protein